MRRRRKPRPLAGPPVTSRRALAAQLSAEAPPSPCALPLTARASFWLGPASHGAASPSRRALPSPIAPPSPRSSLFLSAPPSPRATPSRAAPPSPHRLPRLPERSAFTGRSSSFLRGPALNTWPGPKEPESAQG